MVLSAAQWLAAVRHFAPGGVLAWDRLALAGDRWVRPIQRRVPPSGPTIFFAVQLFLAVLLAIVGTPMVTIMCLTALIACHVLFVLLSGTFWVGGAEKMGLIAMTGALITAVGVAAGDAGVAAAGILLAGGQLVISYFVAGASKLFVPGWRNGTWLSAILATGAWGNARMPGRLRTGGFAIAASWSVIVLETLFPLALFAPETWLLAAMAAMLSFHIATAVLMGLNRFPWAFAAAYPAAFLLGRIVREAAGLSL